MIAAVDGSGGESSRTPGPGDDRLRDAARRNASGLASAAFVALAIGSATLGGSWVLAAYALSFWHYYLYWLAYRFGAVPLAVFKRDALAMKAVALVTLGAAYFAAPLDAASLAVVASGFLLNACAAAALGSDRTYYGHEVAGLPRRRISAFPYSVMAHPMLVGNAVAFGGTLLSPGFREHWWPLACAHVALNLALWLMERRVTPLRRGARPGGPGAGARPWSLGAGCLFTAAGAALGAAAGGWWDTPMPLGAVMGASACAYACVLYGCYAFPPPPAPAAQPEASQ